MFLDKNKSSLTNTNVNTNTKIATKQTSNVSTNIENNIPGSLNLSYSIFKDEKNLKSKIISDTPKLKRSQSHKRHHFKVDIKKIINEEQNEDDNFEGRNFLHLNKVSGKILNDCSPKTQYLIFNLLSDKYYTWEQIDNSIENYDSKEEDIKVENFVNSNESSFIDDLEKIFPHKIMDIKKKKIKKANTNIHNSSSNSNSDEINGLCFNFMHSNSSVKEKIKYIPTILGRILKEEEKNKKNNE
jgi:hypothetical protein